MLTSGGRNPGSPEEISSKKKCTEDKGTRYTYSQADVLQEDHTGHEELHLKYQVSNSVAEPHYF
jgi:hypothetical protein